jgi:hypothetical protein
MTDIQEPDVRFFPRTTSQLREALRRAWYRFGVTEQGKPSPGEDLDSYVPWRFPRVRGLPKKLRLWLMLYDESIACIVALHICCEAEMMQRVRDQVITDDLRDTLGAIYRLSARSVSDLYAVRNLVSFGLEPAARVVLRSAMEHLDTISLFLLEPARAHDFLTTSEPKEGNTFWHRHLSKEKLRNVIRAYFKGIDEDLAYEHLSRREARNAIYGVAVHPSAYSCDMAIFTPEGIEYERDSGHLGIGYPTVLSCNTLHDAMLSIFEVGIVLKMRALDPAAPLAGLISNKLDKYFLGVVVSWPSILLSILTTVGHPSLRAVYFDFIRESQD